MVNKKQADGVGQGGDFLLAKNTTLTHGIGLLN